MRNKGQTMSSQQCLTPIVATALAAIFPWLVALPAQASGPLQGNPVDAIPDLQRPARPQPAPQVVPPTPEQEAVLARLRQRIVPRNFDVVGSTAIPFERISAILSPLAGKETTVAELVQHVNRITALYQQEGYPLSFALLQDQTFQDGLVAVTVVEGHVQDVRIEGDIGQAQHRLMALAAPLQAERPLTRATLERVLNLMRAVPGVRLEVKLDMPKRADGRTDMVLLASHRPVGISAGVADLGTGMQGLVNLTANSLSPLGEQVKLTAAVPVNAQDVRYLAGTVTVPIGSNGLALEVDGHHYRSEPRDHALYAQGWDRTVANDRIGAGVSYPLILDNRRLLSISLGVYATRSKDQYLCEQCPVAGGGTYNNAWIRQETRLRVARLGLRYRDASQTQSRDITLGIHKGFDAAGASKGLLRNFAPDLMPSYALSFTRVTLNLKQTLSLPAQFGLALSASGQYSSNVLPSAEQIGFGAWRHALGYPQGDMGGDKGYGVSLEVNRRFNTQWQYLSSIQPYLVLDHARAWYNDATQRPLNGRKLASAAFGLRLTDDRRYLIDVNVAKPIGDAPLNSRRKLRFNANYTMFYDGL